MTNEQLVSCIKAGVNVSENMFELWQQNRNFIHTIARRYQDNAELEDLEQEGYLALYDAVDGFKPEYGYKFLTYATMWIKQRMIRYTQNNKTIHIPEDEYEKLCKYKKLVNVFRLNYGRKPTRNEIAHNLGIPVKKVAALIRADYMGHIESLDSYLSENNDSLTIGEMVAGNMDVEADVMDDIQNMQLKEVLWPLVDALPDNQGKVIRQRYQEGKTLKETGLSVGASIDQVRNIETKALHNLRHSRSSKELRLFCDDEIYGMGICGTSNKNFNTTWTSSTERAAMKMYQGLYQLKM